MNAPRTRYPTLACALASGVLASALTPVAAAQTFLTNDIYLISPVVPDPSNGTIVNGILRITPGTWAKTLVYSDPIVNGAGAYDPARDRMVLPMLPLRLVAADGTTSTIALSWGNGPSLVAPVGDGRIYIWSPQTNDARRIIYVDNANVQHTLMNDANTAPFVPPADFLALMYDRATNSLLGGGGGAVDSFVVKMPLSPAGDRIQGAVVTATINASTSGEVVVALSRGPGGKAFVKIDDNSNDTNPRMQTIDPVTMVAQPFASSGYFGVGGEVAGVYDPFLGAAVVLDSLNDVLRTFGSGASGDGIIVTRGVSNGGASGELAQLILPRPPQLCAGDIAPPGFGNGIVDVNDLLAVITAWGNCPAPCPPTCAADVNHDCVVNVNDLLAIITSWGACP